MDLIRHCTACTGPLPDGARFCPSCGQAVNGVETAVPLDQLIGQALSTELRFITVVFCDLVGSTELSSTTDAEEYSELIEAYQHQAVRIARDLGGDVEGYSGDGILIRFGWPQAHDDDAARALAAALDIVAAVDALELSWPLVVRVGVHSGPAVVGEFGGADRRATMAVGETLNVAARLQGAAEPGTVVASAATMSLVRGLFEASSLGPLQLRGVTEPVEGFRVSGRSDGRSRVDTLLTGLSPLVGREVAVATLAHEWDLARAGHGRTVLMTGEPGVGKSRMALQLRELVAGDDPLWIEASCSSYTRMSVLRPVIDLMEDALSFHDDPDPAWRLARIREQLDEAEVDVTDGDELIARLLGIPDVPAQSISGELRLERTIEALVAWVVALSRTRPVVLLIEDLHWCDPTTLDAVQRLIERIGDSPILVLLTARPEFESRWSSDSTVATVDLVPLEGDDVRQLVTSLGEGRRLPEEVLDRIVASAGGIPLYVEEVGRTLLESGLLVSRDDSWELASPLVDLEIPGTLQGSLLARLDGLGPAKAVAQLAAVVGRSFTFDLLVSVSGMDPLLLRESLDRVVGSGLVLHDPVHHESDYTFKHVLVQEVVYESLLRRNRRTIHERVARALDDREATGQSTAAEVVARHYEAAGILQEAAVHFRTAARVAAERSGHREAIAFLTRAIELARQLPDRDEGLELEVELQLALGSSIATRSYSDPSLAVAYERARELCELIGNDERIGQALGGLSVYYLNHGDIALGAELAERVLAIAEVSDDDLLEVLGTVQLSLARCFQGRAPESLALADQAIATYHPEHHLILGHRFGTDQGVAAHVFAGWSHLLLGHLDRGLAQLAEAVTLADSIGQPFNRVFALAFLATGHCERGESEETLRFAEQARRLAEEQGFAFWAGISGVWESAERVIAQGDKEALAAVIEAGMVAGETGNRGGSTNVLGRMAEAARAAGDRDTTEGILDIALAVSDETVQPWWDSALYRIRAELSFAAAQDAAPADLSDPDHPWARAERAWLRSLELAERMGFPLHGSRAAAGYAGLLQRVGRVDEGSALLASWYARCPEGLGTPVLTAIRSQLEALDGIPI